MIYYLNDIPLLLPLWWFQCGGWISACLRITNGQWCKHAAPSSAGCTSWSTAGVSSNSRPHLGDGKRCVVKDGVTLHALCCHAPSLECHLLENISADKDQVSYLNMNSTEMSLMTTSSALVQTSTLPIISAVLMQVEVTCPSGWTLTDCGTVSQDSAVLGPVAKGNSCRVRGATGGAAGLAVCCRVRPAEQPVTAPQWACLRPLWSPAPWEQPWYLSITALVSLSFSSFDVL